MAKWKIVRREVDTTGRFTPVDLKTDYTNVHLRDAGIPVCHAIVVRGLISIAGETAASLGFPETPTVERTATGGWKRVDGETTIRGEYNGMGYYFIRVRDDVTLDDFEIETIE